MTNIDYEAIMDEAEAMAKKVEQTESTALVVSLHGTYRVIARKDGEIQELYQSTDREACYEWIRESGYILVNHVTATVDQFEQAEDLWFECTTEYLWEAC